MGGNKTQTTTESKEPWSAAQPALKTAIGDAQNLYKAGIGFQPYTGSTVVPFANQTMQGMNMQQGAAQGSQAAFDGNFDRINQILGQGGLNDLQRQSIDLLTPMAQGDYLTKNNPYTDAVVNRTADRMGSQVNLMASGMGRTGSGAHQGVLAREIGDMANQAYMQDYNRERGFQQDAIGSLFNAGQQQFANQMQGTGALMDAYAGRMQPGQTLQNIGANYEDLATRQMNDQLRIFNETQRAPWAALEQLNAIASGAGRLGGTQTQTAQGPSRLGAGIGGAIAGGTMGGPLGAALGGLGGLFF